MRFCSSGQSFAHWETFQLPKSGFLQIPPHDGHPCLWLALPATGRTRLSPYRTCAHRAHKIAARSGACALPGAGFLSVLHCGFFVEIRHCRGRNSAFRVISVEIPRKISQSMPLYEMLPSFLRKYYETMNSINQYKAALFGNFHQKRTDFRPITGRSLCSAIPAAGDGAGSGTGKRLWIR